VIRRVITISCIILFSLTSPCYAQKKQQLNEPVLLHADDLTFDNEKNIITAQGHVQVYQEQEVLTADSLTYDRNQDKITAKGNVVWQRETGDVFFGSYIELQNQMKDGVIREFRGLLIDESRLASNLGKRKGGTETQMDQAVYSPCKVCKQEPNKPPLWQLKAQTALWDETAHDIIYTDAWLEFFGVPTLYTPYLRHPDPTVKQRSGLLAPTINTRNDLGFYVALPYYYLISPDKDITLTPLLTTKKGQFLGVEYRQRLSDAKLVVGGSYGWSEKDKKHKTKKDKHGNKKEIQKDAVRGHIDSSMEWDVNENWRFRGNLLRSTDHTYLRKFPFYGHDNDAVLTSQAKAEGFYGLSYIRAQAMLYQGQREHDRQRTTPIVAPVIDVNYVSPAQFWNSRFLVDANTLVINRHEGTSARAKTATKPKRMATARNVQRVSSTASWRLPFVSPLGDRYALSLRMRGDGYNYDDYIRGRHHHGKHHDKDGTKGRLFPQAYLEWEYPWIKTFDQGNVIISPMASLVVAPKVGGQSKIPNEDCNAIEPNDEYILSHSRLLGLDRIDDGSRVNYGFKADSRFTKDITGGAFIGQTASFSEPNPIFKGTGFHDKLSDYMGRVNLNLYQYFDIRYRFRLKKKTFTAVRNELNTSIGIPEFRINIDYLKLPRSEGQPLGPGKQQIGIGLSSAFTKGWTAGIGTRRDLGKRSHSLAHTASLSFDNECLTMGFQLSKTFYKDGDLKPAKGFMFILAFKTMGGQVLGQFKLNQQFKDSQNENQEKKT
jgi:LPS-assembly protein